MMMKTACERKRKLDEFFFSVSFKQPAMCKKYGM